MPTLVQILTVVKKRAGKAARRAQDFDLAPTDADDDLLEIYARQGAIELALRTRRALARATIDVVADQASYSVGLSVDDVLRVDYQEDGAEAATRLLVAPGDEIRSLIDEGQATSGTPTHVGFFGSQIYLYVPPGANGTLRLYYRPNSLVGESDATFETDELPADELVNLFPPELEKPLQDWTLAQWYLEIDEHARATPLLGQFEDAARRYQGDPRQPKLTLRPHRPF